MYDKLNIILKKKWEPITSYWQKMHYAKIHNQMQLHSK